MKNNGFKKILTNEIKNECKAFDFQCVAVDESIHSRMIYIYTLDWRCVGIFSCWFTDDYLHLQFTTDLEKPIIQARDKDVRCNYTQFNKIMMLVQGAFEMMDKLDEN
jgi:hypothetical protein